MDASFIYWQPSEDNLEFAIVANVPTGVTGATQTAVLSTNLSGNVVGMNFGFDPGFKVGFGGYFDYDNWDVHAEYTWFHTSNSKSVSVDATSVASQVIVPMNLHPGYGGTLNFASASEKWRMNMDLVDLDLGRWYYVGTKLMFRTGYGARAAFIRQTQVGNFSSPAGFAFASSPAESVHQTNRSNSWGLGPRASLDTYWMLGEGFRIFGCGEADILYTQYTKINNRIVPTRLATSGTATGQVDVTEKNLSTVRTHLDLELGLGWGTYWDCNNWYTDVALGYEFQVFFDQNMLRHFSNVTAVGNSFVRNGNLYAQGLTATFSLTF